MGQNVEKGFHPKERRQGCALTEIHRELEMGVNTTEATKNVLQSARYSATLYVQRVKLRELDITGFIQFIVYALLGENITVLGSPQVFDKRIS